MVCSWSDRIVTMIHKMTTAVATCTVIAALSACAPVPFQQLGRYDHTVVSDTERTCVGDSGRDHALAHVEHAAGGTAGADVLVFTVRGDVADVTATLQASSEDGSVRRVVAFRDGHVAANLITDDAGTRDVDDVPAVDGSRVTVSLPAGSAGAFTGTGWYAGMEMDGTVVSACGNTPIPAYGA